MQNRPSHIIAINKCVSQNLFTNLKIIERKVIFVCFHLKLKFHKELLRYNLKKSRKTSLFLFQENQKCKLLHRVDFSYAYVNVAELDI